MDFTMKDIALIVTMSGAIIFMSFTFPALGLADSSNETAASDIPEFNTSGNNWDLAGEFPDRPGSPTRGVLNYDQQIGPNVKGMSLDTLDGTGDTSLTVGLQNGTINDDFEVTVTFQNTSGTSTTTNEYRYNFTGEDPGYTVLHEEDGWVIEFRLDSIENYDDPNFTAAVEYTVLKETENAPSGLAAIPVIGGLFSAGSELASGLAWIGTVIWWFLVTTVEIILTLVTILLSVMSYAVSMMHWLLSSYFAIVAGAPSWSAVVVVLPGIALFLEFAKLAMLGIKLLPTT